MDVFGIGQCFDGVLIGAAGKAGRVGDPDGHRVVAVADDCPAVAANDLFSMVIDRAVFLTAGKIRFGLHFAHSPDSLVY